MTFCNVSIDNLSLFNLTYFDFKREDQYLVSICMICFIKERRINQSDLKTLF